MKALALPIPSGFTGTKHIHLIICPLIFISACSVFKEKSFYQADSLLRRKEKFQLKAVENLQIKRIGIHGSEDSSDKQYSVEISPKGSFKYSMSDGFSGEAERVVLSGRIKEGKKVRDLAGHVQTSSLDLAAKGSEISRSNIRLREKALRSDYSHFYFLAGCLAIFILIYVFRRFLAKPVV